ncbi:MAG TPA: hypothetical protein VES73_07805 [Lamprocystis sp. (in: g-proteobacteria)]|nr:hypothetical protein [Lamprocystis sp. (in: g-proteobacteria)]
MQKDPERPGNGTLNNIQAQQTLDGVLFRTRSPSRDVAAPPLVSQAIPDMNDHIGSRLDDFLDEDALLTETDAIATFRQANPSH